MRRAWVLLAFLVTALGTSQAAERGEAIFAGGCFWCEEAAFEGVPGVSAVISGYTGGVKKSPTYDEVSAGTTAHAEAVRVVFDPAKITYARLLEIFWRSVDPLSANGQFCDRGTQYRSGIFYLDDAQKRAADESKKRVQAQLKGAVVTEVTKAAEFYPAEEYHQDFFKKNPVRYQGYRLGCGRDRRLKELWGAGAGH
ncbi:MAG: peptide-methionine (S)-S-oxide reductase [Myxococcales bacterium]|nr:peptide-methionine (S)-S-oxide reductase [Myxococcales bacterium]